MFGLFYFLMLLPIDSIPATNVTVKVNLADKFATEDQWVYLFQIDDNELFPLDSCRIYNKQKNFIFQGYLYKKDSHCWIAFSEKGPTGTFLYLDPGDEVEIEIINDGMMQPARGSLTVEMDYASHLSAVEITKQIEVLEKDMESLRSNGDAIGVELVGELDRLKYELNIGRHLDYLRKTNSAARYRTTLRGRLKENLPKDEYEELIQEMKRKFPDDVKVQMYPDYPPSDPPSERSRYWLTRYGEMFDKSVGITRPRVEVEKFNGVDFGDLTLPDATGNEVSLSDISTPYIFVDFWASWCVPCRREVPHIKAALDKYGDEFTVYAVSLDEDKHAWIEAIAKDGSEELVHVLMGVDNDKAMAIRQKYGITSIPANFLIDSDLKVIATNLRGEQLEEKLKELTE